MRRYSAVLLLLLLCPAIHASTSHRTARTRLIKELLHRYPEDGFSSAPSANGTLIVTVHLSVYSVFGLNENEVLEMNGWVRVVWKDPLFQWKPEEWSNETSVVVPASKIWAPDIGISNSKQIESKDFTQLELLKVEVKSSGEATYMGYFLSETPCPINARMFPFDRQLCPLMIGTYHSRRSAFEIRLGTVKADTQKEQCVSQWKLIAYRKQKEIIQAGRYNKTEDMFQVVEIDFLLERKPLYHIVLIIIPCCLICLVGAVMFVIRGSEERYGVSLTIFLAMSVYVMISANSTPKSMVSLSVLDVFLLVQLCLLVILTFVIVFGPIIFGKGEPHRKDSDEEKGDDDDDPPITPAKLSRYSFIGKRFCLWSRPCDFFCLGAYLLGSSINLIVCMSFRNRSSDFD